MIDNDSDTTSIFPSDSGLLELSQRETSSLPNFPVVSDGLSTNGGAEMLKWSNAEGSSLGLAGLTTTELSSWLVEPGANTELPVLTEMVLVEDWVERAKQLDNKIDL